MNTLRDTDEGRARPLVWPVYVAAGVVLIVGLVFLARAQKVIPQTHECDLSEIAAYTGIILPENTALLGCKFWAWHDFSKELVAKVRFRRRDLDLFVNSLPGEPSRLAPPLGPDSPPRPLMNETAMRGVGAWWNPDAAIDYMHISSRIPHIKQGGTEQERHETQVESQYRTIVAYVAVGTQWVKARRQIWR